tara:strand:+ start:27629 stop:28072 length:444 start_codon:yes stop_codon:yes gene_type:complete
MGKKRTGKSTFKSIYSDGFVTPAQYLTEALCFLIARKRGQNLSDKFWEDAEWAKFFRHQVSLANELLQEYDIKAILSALKDRRIKNKIRSLGAKFMIVPVIKEYQKKLNYQNNRDLEVTPKAETTEKPRKPIGNKSILSRLRDIDNE